MDLAVILYRIFLDPHAFANAWKPPGLLMRNMLYCATRERKKWHWWGTCTLHLLEVVTSWHGNKGHVCLCAYGPATIKFMDQNGFFACDSCLCVLHPTPYPAFFVLFALWLIFFFPPPAFFIPLTKEPHKRKKRSFNIYAIIESGKLFQITLHLSLLCSHNSPSVTGH